MIVSSASNAPSLWQFCYVTKRVNSKWQYRSWFCLHQIRGKAEFWLGF